MELLQIKCPTCHSAVLQSHTTYATQHHGRRIIYKCANCPTYFSETKNTLMAGVKTPVSVIWQVVKARTEGMGLNAAARTFEKAKNTILAWERKFLDLHQVLFLYALVHEFLVQVPIKGGLKSCGLGHWAVTFGHHFSYRFSRPLKRMGMFIPFCDKGHQPLRQVLLVRKIGDPQPLALQDREPLLDLVHPGTMHGQIGRAHV